MLRTTSIEVYECNETAVTSPPKSQTFHQLATKQQDISFRGVQLAHAVVKADYLDRRSLLRPGIAFLLQAQDILKVGSSTITLQDDLNDVFNDFSITGLIGRLGQGLTILYAQRRLGMQFVAHLQSYLAASTGRKRGSEATADFVFERGGQTFLFESKASFTLQQNDPSRIRGRLKDALERQVDPWMKRLTPAPSNGYVVYSCLRESTWVPSAMFVVDPPGESNSGAEFALPPQQVWRENYGAWLRAMGLGESGQRLVRGAQMRGEPRRVAFALRTIGGRRYGVGVGVGVDPVRWTVSGLILKPSGVPRQHAAGHARGH